MQKDPFQDSVRELRELVVKAKLIHQGAVQKGVVNAEKVAELNEIRADADELLDLLREMLRVIEEKGGKVHGTVFSANEMMDRQNTLRSLEADVKEIDDFDATVKARAMPVIGSPSSEPRLPDEFLTAQEYVQREEAMQQDEVLERLTYGLQELRETGININDELNTQDVILTDMDREISGVQVRLRAANAKVDKLLASMSNKGKVCTIVVLIFVLVFLAFFAFG